MSYDEILASIDGALADGEFPDAMRWSPEPAAVDAPAPFDGTLVWQPPQRYEGAGSGGSVAGHWPSLIDWALQAEQQHERDLARLREAFAPAAEAMTRLAAAFQEIVDAVGVSFAAASQMLANASASTRPISSPRTLRDDDPRAYALQLRRSRGTGPDRQIQHQPRPRNHR